MKAKVIGGNLRMRNFASLSADVLKILPEGMEISVESIGDEWSRVKVEEEDGYVMTQFLKVLPENKKTKTAKKAAPKKTAKEPESK